MADQVDIRLGKVERHRRIIAELRANPTVRISTLASAFGVSTETVRRDIDALSGEGLVSRTYGGAATTSLSREPAVDVRGDTMVAERQAVVRRAVALLQPGCVLMIDAGSTTTRFAQQLAIEGLQATVITNSLGVASALGFAETVRVVLCPGQYVGRENGVYGPEAADFLGQYHADIAVISGTGLTAEGLTDADPEASWIKRAMIARAERTLVLLDHGKYGVRSLSVVCPLEDIGEIVCDRPPEGEIAQALARGKVKTLV